MDMKIIVVNPNALKSKIILKYGSVKKFSGEFNCSRQFVTLLVNGRQPVSIPNMAIIVKCLNLTNKDISEIFEAKKKIDLTSYQIRKEIELWEENHQQEETLV